MASSDFYQENKGKFGDLLLNSKDVLFIEFNKKGKILHANKTLNELLLCNADNINNLSVSNIFDFRITEIEKILSEKTEYSCDINLVNTNNEFIPTRTKFIKNDETITAVSFLLYDFYEDKKPSVRLEKTLETVKTMLLKQPDSEKDVFLRLLDEIKNLINYDQAVVFLLEGDSLIVKTSENTNNIEKNYRKKITEKDTNLAKLIKERKSISENKDITLLTELNIELDNETKSVLAVPLLIREMVYGLVVLANTKQCFNKDDVKILEAVVSASSYIIKDAELSDVFKMQLRVLKDNIRERTKTLEFIKEQNQKILEADRIKNEFLANMSHELRTPLNAIIGFSEALNLKIFGELNEKQSDYVNDIYSSGIHLLQMINDLLDLSKIESGKMELYTESFNPKNASEEAISILKPLAEKKNINLNLDFINENKEIIADKRKFQQILYNLLSNAIKFTNNNGNVFITGLYKNNELEISVKDEGIGISPDYHEKIFEKFQQVDNTNSGRTGSTGLGLTITKELIEMHGGEIRLESEEGKGADFIFTLPLDRKE